MDLKIDKITVGELKTNCYVVKSHKKCFLVDPGAQADKIIEAFGGCELLFILLTHCHFDHVLALEQIIDNYSRIKVYVHQADNELLKNLSQQRHYSRNTLKNLDIPVKRVKDNQTIKFEDYEITVITTPGHSHGSVCYLINDNLFSGDTLFYHAIGRTDFWTGDPVAMRKSLQKLARLPKNTLVLPGHGRPTTIQEELKSGYLIT